MTSKTTHRLIMSTRLVSECTNLLPKAAAHSNVRWMDGSLLSHMIKLFTPIYERVTIKWIGGT